jgi:hypothetical protein
MLGSRSFYCIFNNDEIFEFQSKKQRDEMYSHGCQFISAADVYRKHVNTIKIPYRQFDSWLPTFIKSHRHVQLSIFDLIEA